MSKLIAIDDGHGMETAGKRTPPFPDGTVMRENEFNRAVADKLVIHLKRCGFKTLLVAPGDHDVPLKVRTDTANAAKADLYVSVHANAFGNAGWNQVRGIETFHYPGSANGKKAAEIIHRHLIGGTRLPDRGVKTANFHVLRETVMPAVLVECGFMTNMDDAKLLLSEAYREECAEELARGICEYFGVPYVGETAQNQDRLPPVQRMISGRLNGEPVPVTAYLIGGQTYVPLRWLAESLGAAVEWNGQKYEFNLKTKPSSNPEDL